MGSAANGRPTYGAPSPAALDGRALAALTPLIEIELRSYLAGCAGALTGSSPFNRSILLQTLNRLGPAECTPEEERRFLLFAAPLARRAVVARYASTSPQAAEQANRFEGWLARLDAFDPLSALMMDLHYFCGLSPRETAAVIDVDAATVVSDLRFARAWLIAYLNKDSTDSSH